MGSLGNPNPWGPLDSYKDCSLGICSRFCPQFCSLIFSPPPMDDDSGTLFSPLIIAIVGVLASTFILVSYYTIVTRYCKRRNDHSNGIENHLEMANDHWHVASTGLDDVLINTITVCKYQKGEGLIEGTECAVCLNEFQEMESLRLLPKCSHAFHLPCIDTWLKSHSNCPLCRANVMSLAPLQSPPSRQSMQNPPALNMHSYEAHLSNHLILVVENQEQDGRERITVSGISDDDVSPQSCSIQEKMNHEENNFKRIKRSTSFDPFSCRPHALILDVVNIEEVDEDSRVSEIGSSKATNQVGMRQSVSKDRLITSTTQDKGKTSVLQI